MLYEMTSRMCMLICNCVDALMIDKLKNWCMCITPVSPSVSKIMPHGVTCGYETQHHTPGITLTSTSIGITRICGEVQNWKSIDGYTPLPGMNVLRWYPHAKRIIFEIAWKRLTTKPCFDYWDRSMYSNNPDAQGCELFSRYVREKID